MGVDLSEVKGTGPGLRVLKDDVKAFVKQALSSSQRGQSAVQRSVKLPDFSQFGDIETVAMDKIQRVTAENMQLSWSTIPHVTQFDQADITELEAFRKSKRNEADARKTKLTMLPFLLK
ncbi:MAG: 2-oxo acid dehydrogenase subunit E2, partial [Amphritea sp.]|nr:2-oxo acid dehydrogenase subunit E2 [Amphritea sp.]